MVCYAVPSAAALACLAARRKLCPHDAGLRNLNLMLFGGGVFGIVDHAWNGELTFIGNNIAMDLALGMAITLAITAAWAIIEFTPGMFANRTKA